MSLFKSGNPTLSENRFKSTVLDQVVSLENVMTVNGTLQKFGFLFLMLMGTAFYAWKEVMAGGTNTQLFIYLGAFGGLGIAILLMFKKEWAPYLSPAYALLEGLFVGAISAYFHAAFSEIAPGIIFNAVGLTFGTAIAMYLLYSFKIIKATEKFKSIIITATAGIAIFYLITIALGFFGITIPFLHEGTAIGIGFSIFVVALAALNLILDFDMIEKGAELGAPKYMEWYGAFGLLVTIIWLYLEILRLLAKINKR